MGKAIGGKDSLYWEDRSYRGFFGNMTEQLQTDYLDMYSVQ